MLDVCCLTTDQLLDSDVWCFIFQLRDSFKELKKRFSNLKFNYVKRNDRTRNMKAVRNQLQQVELYEEKLQVSLAPDLSLWWGHGATGFPFKSKGGQNTPPPKKQRNFCSWWSAEVCKGVWQHDINVLLTVEEETSIVMSRFIRKICFHQGFSYLTTTFPPQPSVQTSLHHLWVFTQVC